MVKRLQAYELAAVFGFPMPPTYPVQSLPTTTAAANVVTGTAPCDTHESGNGLVTSEDAPVAVGIVNMVEDDDDPDSIAEEKYT